MAFYDPTSSIVTGTNADLDNLIASLKDKLPAKAASVAVNTIATPISTTSGTAAIITNGATPASITLSFDSAQHELALLIATAHYSGSVKYDAPEFDIYNGTTAVLTRRSFVQDALASYDGYAQQVVLFHPILGGLSGNVTYSLRWRRQSGTGTLECGYYSIAGVVLKLRS